MDRTNEELCLLIQSGDQQAKTDIYNKNKRLVKKIASQYFGAYGNSLEREDLEQVGYMGLFIAAEKFNADKGVKFISYAAYWIKREIMREIAEHGYPVRIPAAVMDKVVKCINLDTSFQQQGLERKERIRSQHGRHARHLRSGGGRHRIRQLRGGTADPGRTEGGGSSEGGKRSEGRVPAPDDHRSHDRSTPVPDPPDG